MIGTLIGLIQMLQVLDAASDVAVPATARRVSPRWANVYAGQSLRCLVEQLAPGREYAFRFRGENHSWTPTSVADLQHAVRGELPEKYLEFARAINEQSAQLMTLRGLFEFANYDPIPLAETAGVAQ